MNWTVRADRGRWTVGWWATPPEGGASRYHRHMTTGSGPKAKKQADELAERMNTKERATAMGLIPKPSAESTTFEAYARKWLDEVVKPHRKVKTHRLYTQRLEGHLLPHFGPLPLGQISRDAVKKFIGTKLTELGRKSVKDIVTTLGCVLKEAMEDGLLSANVAHNSGRFFGREDATAAQETVKALTEDEVRRMIQAAAKWTPQYEDLLHVLFLTGLREGEALALQWSDLSLARRFMTVRRTLVQDSKVLVNSPKNSKTRDVDLHASLVLRLRNRRSILEASAAVDGKPLEPWIFPAGRSTASRPMDDGALRKAWKALARRAGVSESARVHDARHTYASLLLQRGESIAYVSKQLGHSSIAITMKVYAHFIPGNATAVLAALGDALTGPELDRCSTAAIPLQHPENALQPTDN